MLTAQYEPLYKAGINFTTAYQNNENNITSFSTPHTPTNPAYINEQYRSNLYLLGNQKSCVTIKVPHRNYLRVFTLYPDSLLTVTLPYSQSYRLEKTVSRGIFIESTSPIQVIYGDNVDSLLKFQTLLSIPNAILSNPEAAGILSVHSTGINPNTRVQHIEKLYTYGVKDPILLDFLRTNTWKRNRTTMWIVQNLGQSSQLEWYWLYGTDGLGATTKTPQHTTRDVDLKADSTYYVDLENTQLFFNILDSSFLKISPTKKVKIYQSSPAWRSNQSEWVMLGNANEELALPYAMDTAFHFGKLKGYEGYVASLQATEDSTRIVINNQKVKYLDKLEGLDTAISEPLSVHSSAPLVGYMANDATDTAGYPRYNNNWNSFFSVAANGDNHLMTESLFATLGKTDGNYHYQLALVCRTADTSQLTLDGKPLPSGSYNPFPADSIWSYANVEVTRGVHRVANPNGFHGFHYNYYLDPLRSDNIVCSNYGYNLAQSVTWPEDSFQYRVGHSSDSTKQFAAFNNQPRLCPGDTLYFYPSSRRNKTWIWEMGDGTRIIQKIGANEPQAFPYTWQEGGNYTVVVRDSVGCAPPDSVHVVVDKQRAADFRAELTPRCNGFQIELIAQNKGAWQWQYPDGESRDSTVIFNYSGALQELPVTFISGQGKCADTARKVIDLPETSIQEPTLPNVFTPNGDGVNDHFCIPGAKSYAECFSLQVFNRYGLSLFSTSDPSRCWSPNSNTPPGVYYYLLRIGANEYRGVLHLQR